MPQSLVAQCFANVSFLSTHDNQNSRNACVSGVFSCPKAGFSLIFSLMRSALPVETVEKGGGRKLPSPSCGIGSILCRHLARPCRLAQLCPRQGADDAVHTQTVGLLERQHGGLCLASEDAVHAAAVKSSRFRIGATVTPNGETHYEIRAPDIDVTVNPAAGDRLDTVALTLPYADTGKHAYTPDWSKLPSGQT